MTDSEFDALFVLMFWPVQLMTNGPNGFLQACARYIKEGK